MRKFLIALACACGLLSGQTADAQRSYKVSVAFYNLENLFDTVDNENNDEDFLPNGANAWTEERYAQKLNNMATVVSQLAGGKAPDVLGLCELENRNVLEDLVAHPAIAAQGYQIVHFDSPDRRGIDVALLYRPGVFKFMGAQPHPVNIPGEPNVKTRDVLEVNGTILGEKFHFLVAHWPSRAGGEQVSLKRRMTAAEVMRRVVDSLEYNDPQSKAILMGDLNDDPISPSLIEGLKSLNNEEQLQGDWSLYNVMAKLHRSGYGTLAYRDVWNLFDNLIVTSNLVNGKNGGLQVQRDKATGAYGRIYNAAFLTQATGHYKGYPLRTMSNGQFQNGYSDHYPVYLFLVKEAK